MSIDLTINGSDFSYPQTGDSNWGGNATSWAYAVTIGMLQKAGGSFTLTAEVDFGATYGLKTAYYKTQTANNASAGAYRLARTDVISWRNQANGANLDLSVNSSNVLLFNGEAIVAGDIVNADISAAAAIAFSKMAALSASRALVSDGSGVVSVATTTSTQIGYLSNVSSDVQTQLDAKAPIASPTFTGTVTLPGDPSTSLEAATKQYVDSLVTGLQVKASCRVATTGNLSVATDLENGDTVDGVVLATNDRVLVKDQSTASQNGIYVVPAAGAASRATDMDTWTETLQAYVFIEEGTANAATGWVSQSTAGGTIGVTSLTFAQFSANTTYTADNQGVLLAGSQFSLQIDGSTLSQSGTGVKVASGGITNTQVNASAAIALSKLAAVTASRALVSDGSGFVSAATTTSTEIGYVNGVTSAIQTQLDAKTLKATLTTRGDMYYASAANTPARLAVGSNGYIIQSDGTDPVWTDQKISFTEFNNSSSTVTLGTTWASLTLAAAASTAGSPWTRSGNNLTAIYTGIHHVVITLSNLLSASGQRTVMARVRNTTDGTTVYKSVGVPYDKDSAAGSTCVIEMWPNITNVSKTYQIQVCTTGGGLQATQETVDSETSYTWVITIERIRQ